MSVDRLRQRVDAAIEKLSTGSDTHASSYVGAITVEGQTVLALLDVAEAAEDIASDDYLEQPPPYATGIRVEEAVALTEAVHRLREVSRG